MRDQAEKLRMTLLGDGGSSETALKEVLRSELMGVFRQYMDVEDIKIEISNDNVVVSVKGNNFKRVGFYNAG